MSSQSISGSGNLGFQHIHDAEINVTQYIGQSADYQAMRRREEELVEMREFYQAKGDAEKALAKSRELEEHRKAVEEFKVNVLQLADTFRSIAINTERLRLAKAKFEAGRFTEANAILQAEEMAAEDRELETAWQRNTAERENLLAKKKGKANEWLIKARIAVLLKSDNSWLDQCRRFFDASLKSYPNLDNLTAYADFLLYHRLYEEAMAVYQQLLDEFADTMPTEKRAAIYNDMGVLHYERLELEASGEFLEKALETYRSLAEQEPGKWREDTAQMLNNLTALYTDMGQWEAALDRGKQALQTYRELNSEHSDTQWPMIATTQYNLGRAYWHMDELSETLSCLQESEHIRRQLADQQPDPYQWHLAETLHLLGMTNGTMSNYQDATAHFQEALAIRKELAQGNPYRFDLDVCESNLSLLLHYRVGRDQGVAGAETIPWSWELIEDTEQRLQGIASENEQIHKMREGVRFYRQLLEG